MKQKIYWTLVFVLSGLTAVAEDKSSPAGDQIVYENNFEKAELDKVPTEFLVLDGGFAVKQEQTNKFIELPGAPLETFGFLFGPTSESDISVSAKMRGSTKGRRFPTYALGLNGVSGYRLQVSPAKKALELFKGDEIAATAALEEKIGAWMKLQLQVTKVSDTEWRVEGKAWLEGSSEPGKAQIVFLEKTKPIAGRASIWGSPYAGTPIQFDDLKIIKTIAGK
ncbi:MAG: hypothetical protein ABIQ35_10020 [Verrucomicrobiota bacterium]